MTNNPDRLKHHANVLELFAALSTGRSIPDLLAAVRAGAEALRDAAVAKEGGSGESAEYPNKAATPPEQATSVRATPEPPSDQEHQSLIDKLQALIQATQFAAAEGGLEWSDAQTPYGKFIAEHGATIIAALQLGLQAEATVADLEAEMATHHKFRVLRERDQWKRRAEAAEAKVAKVLEDAAVRRIEGEERVQRLVDAANRLREFVDNGRVPEPSEPKLVCQFPGCGRLADYGLVCYAHGFKYGGAP